MPTLKIFANGNLQSEEEIDWGGIIVGRGDDVELRLDETKLSRRHVAIFPDGKAWHLEDLGSKNGTFVNGRKEVRRELADGDRIELGAYVLQFRRDPSEAVPPASRPHLGPGTSPAEATPAGGTVAPRPDVFAREGGASEYRPRRDLRGTETADPRLMAKLRNEARTLLGPRLVEEGTEKIHVLAKDRTVFGASTKADVCVPAIGYDEAAALQKRADGRFEIQKLGWLSRVKVNDATVNTQLLAPGDVVRLGKVTFTYEEPLG